MIPYHHRPKFSVRPHNFRLVQDHPLWIGCQNAILDGTGRDYSLNKLNAVLRPNGGTITTQVDGTIQRETYHIQSQANLGLAVNNAMFGPNIAATVAMLLKLDNGSPSYSEDGFWRLGNSQYPEHYAYTFDGRHYLSTFGPSGQEHAFTPQLNSSELEQWHHVTCTATPGANNWRFYENATLSYQDVQASTLDVGPDPNIGYHPYDTGFSLNGVFADVLFWDRIITPAEMSVLGRLHDPMLDGAIEPIPKQTYFIPTEAPTPPTLVTDIFQSAIIGE